jgi:hypothetical protein
MAHHDPRYTGSWQLNLTNSDVNRIARVDIMLSLRYEMDKLADKAANGYCTNRDRARIQEIDRRLRDAKNKG